MVGHGVRRRIRRILARLCPPWKGRRATREVEARPRKNAKSLSAKGGLEGEILPERACGPAPRCGVAASP